MFVDNKVVKSFEGEERYDRFAIASTMFDVSFKGASCSVINLQVLNNCDGCNIKFMYKKIDEIIQEYTDKITVLTDSFSFGN